MRRTTPLSVILSQGIRLEKLGIVLYEDFDKQRYIIEVGNTPLKGIKSGGEFQSLELAIQCFEDRVQALQQHYQTLSQS